MAINTDAVGKESDVVEKSWNSKDCILYALGCGSGTDELSFATEKNQKVLPTFGVILGSGVNIGTAIGDFNPAMLVHGEQSIELAGPIPTKGTVKNQGRIAEIWDKGSGAVIAFETESRDATTDKILFINRSSIFIRGEGGFGGDRGPQKPPFVAPNRKPEVVVNYNTKEEQALIYRLSGDRNPLHSDPEFAKMGGFDKPILHGLCTYGFTGRALLNSLCDGDPAKFKSISGRFSKPVLPGQELTINIWVDGNQAKFQTCVEGSVVIDHGEFAFVTEKVTAEEMV